MAVEQFQAAFERVTYGLALTDAAGRIDAVNAAFQRILSLSPGAAAGRMIAELVGDRAGEALAAALSEAVSAEAKERRLELHVSESTERPVWLLLTINAESVHTGQPVLIQVEDISAEKRFARHLEYNASHDRLTGLPNRTALQGRMQRMMHSSSTPLALIALQILRYREINDAFGEAFGDRLLDRVATRLRELVGPDTMLARLGGDEFAVLLPDAEQILAEEEAQRLLAALREPLDLGDQVIDLAVAAGIVCSPLHARHTHALLHRVELALRAAATESAGLAVFLPAHEGAAHRRLELAGTLHRAIDRDQLTLRFQPKVDFRSRKPIGVEALVRWQHPNHGLLAPNEFIPLAEQAGMVQPLTAWVLARALEQVSRWHQKGIDLPVAVNLSARTLHDLRLLDLIERALATAGVEPSMLLAEVTEGAVMIDPRRGLSVLTALREMGVEIAIDDFGTGYSNLTYLDRLPASELKIDRSFVQDMTQHEGHFRIVHGTIDIGHDLGLRTVAEGIEDKGTLDALASLGCDAAQGYYVAPPLPGDELTEWVLARAGSDGVDEPTA